MAGGSLAERQNWHQHTADEHASERRVKDFLSDCKRGPEFPSLFAARGGRFVPAYANAMVRS
jgi:hypothetical protein